MDAPRGGPVHLAHAHRDDPRRVAELVLADEAVRGFESPAVAAETIARMLLASGVPEVEAVVQDERGRSGRAPIEPGGRYVELDPDAEPPPSRD